MFFLPNTTIRRHNGEHTVKYDAAAAVSWFNYQKTTHSRMCNLKTNRVYRREDYLRQKANLDYYRFLLPTYLHHTGNSNFSLMSYGEPMLSSSQQKSEGQSRTTDLQRTSAHSPQVRKAIMNPEESKFLTIRLQRTNALPLQRQKSNHEPKES